MATTPQTAPAYRRRLAESIIASHSSGAHGRLPTERQLASELGVTRTMIRHALAVLEAEGRISREVGRGTFIRDAGSWRGGTTPAMVASDDVGPAHVMAVRRVIEPQVLPLVVAWATARDFDELRRCLEGG